MQQFDVRKIYMKRVLFLLMILTVSAEVYPQVFPMDTIMRNGARSNRINFAYLADGYETADLGTFITNSSTINNQMFSQTPFLEYKNFFNAFCIKVPSDQSGAIHSSTAPDCPPVGDHPIDSP